MKTSIDLPDELYREVKSRSALEGRAVREVATALFSAWLADSSGKASIVDDSPMPASPLPR